MDNKPILYGIVGLVLGVAITTFTASNAVNTNNTGMMRMMGMQQNGSMMGSGLKQQGMMGGMGMESSMEEMMESMEGKTGDEFDRAFMDAMTVHHQGAIEMAQEALNSSDREEIRKMANDIISAQTKEIEMMRQWKEDWR